MTQTLPLRLHHNAWTTRDHEANRVFYEDVLGFPLIAVWAEDDVPDGAKSAYCHALYGLGDGSALAFFQFADPADQDRYAVPVARSAYRHIAFKVDKDAQDGMLERLTAAGYGDGNAHVIDHGFCVSLYVTDPNGLILEFVVDHPDVEKIDAERRATAHQDLARWLGGDHASNNRWR